MTVAAVLASTAFVIANMMVMLAPVVATPTHALPKLGAACWPVPVVLQRLGLLV